MLVRAPATKGGRPSVGHDDAGRWAGVTRCAWRCVRRPCRPRRPATRPAHKSSLSASRPTRYAAVASRPRSSGPSEESRSAADSCTKASAHARRSKDSRPRSSVSAVVITLPAAGVTRPRTPAPRSPGAAGMSDRLAQCPDLLPSLKRTGRGRGLAPALLGQGACLPVRPSTNTHSRQGRVGVRTLSGRRQSR